MFLYGKEVDLANFHLDTTKQCKCCEFEFSIVDNSECPVCGELVMESVDESLED